jgi:hypothetical protein
MVLILIIGIFMKLAFLGKVCRSLPSRGAQRRGDSYVVDWEAKMDCFASLEMTGWGLESESSLPCQAQSL